MKYVSKEGDQLPCPYCNQMINVGIDLITEDDDTYVDNFQLRPRPQRK